MAAISNEVNRLVEALFEPPSLFDRVRGEDRRRNRLEQIVASGEFRVVPALLTVLALDKALSDHTARAIAHLVRGIGPAELGWLDEEARRGSYVYGPRDPWMMLRPEAVRSLAKTAAYDPGVIGLLASHPNGFVRAAALDELAPIQDGRELPFLALRANDWVEPVAVKATELLANRLRPENRYAVLEALPFVIRTLGQRRWDHADVARALRSVLLSDGGGEALACANRFDTKVRRFLYELLSTEGAGLKFPVVKAALADPDAVIRARAIRRLDASSDTAEAATVLERLLREDPVPAVRRLALTVLSERLPERIPQVFPSVLLDRAASVRGLARFIVGTHRVPIVPRDFYAESLTSTVPRELAAAIDGVGETGARADMDLLTPFLRSATPRVRRAALRAFARLDLEHAIPLGIEALGDDAPSVRTAGVNILTMNASRIDFSLVNRRLQTLLDSRARQGALKVLGHAPKWDAAAFLLMALGDTHEEVRMTASRLLDSWVADFNRNQTQPRTEQLERIRHLLDSVATRMSEETVDLLRFSLKAQ